MQSTCKDCRKARAAAWRAENPEEVARRAHASYMKYRERKDAYGREWRKKNPDKHKEYALKRLYGLTLAQREAMKASQGNACAICRRPFKQGKEPHIDHDHATGKVRGILCGGCNIVLGHLEKPGYIEAAQQYLRLHSGLQTEPRVA